VSGRLRPVSSDQPHFWGMGVWRKVRRKVNAIVRRQFPLDLLASGRLMSDMRFIEPCLPIISRSTPTGAGWVYEIKHDGFRFLAVRHRKQGMGVPWLSRPKRAVRWMGRHWSRLRQPANDAMYCRARERGRARRSAAWRRDRQDENARTFPL
jgi:hypothetical protein